MAKSNAEPIAAHLFGGNKLPYDILSQDHCKQIEMSRGKFFGHGAKKLFLKVLAEELFSNPSGSTSFNKENTLLIDDSPEKSVCNETGNALILDTWSHGTRRDDLLLGVLLPWLQRLVSECQPGRLREYVDAHRIGKEPWGRYISEHKAIIDAMMSSARNLGTRFELPAKNLVIEPPRSSLRARS